MLKSLKQGVLKSAKSFRLLDLVGNSRWRRNRLLILGYHGVPIQDEHLWNSELFMPSETLRRRFEIIKKNGCTVLSLGDAVKRLYIGTLPAKSIVITFDDGMYNFYKVALPILKEFNFPATLYLTTFYSGYNKPVFGIAADYLLWKAKTRSLNCNSLLGRNEIIDLDIEDERRRCHSLIIAYAEERKLSAEQKNELLRDLCVELHIDFTAFCDSRLFQLMTPYEVAESASSGVDIELHTHRHRVPLDEELFKREIEDNRRFIEQATANNPSHFCYPSGVYDQIFFPWLKTADVDTATTCYAALSSRMANPLLLPRLVDTPSLSDTEFEGWVTGLADFLPRRRS